MILRSLAPINKYLNSKRQIPILQDWPYIPDFFLKTFPKNVHQNLYWMPAAKNQQSTEFKMADVKPVITKRRQSAWKESATPAKFGTPVVWR